MKDRLALAAMGVLWAASATRSPAAPPWYRTRGTSAADQGWCVAVDPQGNAYLGTTGMTSNALTDWFVDKISPSGERLWQLRWGGPGQDAPFELFIDGARIYVGGPATPAGNAFGDKVMAVVPLRLSDGGMDWPAPAIWNPSPDYEEVDGLVVDTSGIYVAGWTFGATTQNDIGLWKLDTSGATVWTRTWGSPGWDEANGQIVVDGARVIVGGKYDGPNPLTGGDALLVAFSKVDGSYQSHVVWGASGMDDTLAITSDGSSIYSVGYSSSFGNSYQIFLLKYDTAFNFQWSRVWGGAGFEASRSLAMDGTDVVIAGQTASIGSGSSDMVLLRYDTAGTLLGSSLWGGSGADVPHAIVIDAATAYVALQTTSDGAGSEDSALLLADARALTTPSFVAGRLLTGPGPGPGNAAEVRVWDQIAPAAPVTSWLAYGVAQDGVNVAGANIESDARFEALSGPGPGAVFGPQARAFQLDGIPLSHVNFYAYGTLRYGVQVAGGDVDGDAFDEILTTPGPGAVFGPHVRGFDDDGTRVSAISKISYYAYGTLRYGARVAGGDTDEDGFDEILTGPGAGAPFGPQIRGWDYDGASIAPSNVNVFAFQSGRYGAAVASGDTDGDGIAEVAAAHGPDPSSIAEVRGFDVTPSAVTQEWSLFASLASGGAEIAIGDVEADGTDELFCGLGWAAANPSRVGAFDIAGSTATLILRLSFDAYPGLSYGVKVGIGAP